MNTCWWSLVDGVVVADDLSRLLGIIREHSLLGTVAEIDRDPAHFGEALVHLRG